MTLLKRLKRRKRKSTLQLKQLQKPTIMKRIKTPNSADLNIIDRGIANTEYMLDFVVLNWDTSPTTKQPTSIEWRDKRINELLDKLSEQLSMKDMITRGEFTFKIETRSEIDVANSMVSDLKKSKKADNLDVDNLKGMLQLDGGYPKLLRALDPNSTSLGYISQQRYELVLMAYKLEAGYAIR